MRSEQPQTAPVMTASSRTPTDCPCITTGELISLADEAISSLCSSLAIYTCRCLLQLASRTERLSTLSVTAAPASRATCSALRRSVPQVTSDSSAATYNVHILVYSRKCSLGVSYPTEISSASRTLGHAHQAIKLIEIFLQSDTSV